MTSIHTTHSSDAQVEIREASLGDIPAIVQIAVGAFRKEYEGDEEKKTAYRERHASRWRSQLKGRHGTVLVAASKDGLVGYLVFRWWFGWNGWIESMALDESHRRRGIGTWLMQALTEKARQDGYQTICFAVDPRDNVEGFYRRLSARKFGELYDNDLRIALHLYSLTIS